MFLSFGHVFQIDEQVLPIFIGWIASEELRKMNHLMFEHMNTIRNNLGIVLEVIVSSTTYLCKYKYWKRVYLINGTFHVEQWL